MRLHSIITGLGLLSSVYAQHYNMNTYTNLYCDSHSRNATSKLNSNCTATDWASFEVNQKPGDPYKGKCYLNYYSDENCANEMGFMVLIGGGEGTSCINVQVGVQSVNFTCSGIADIPTWNNGSFDGLWSS